MTKSPKPIKSKTNANPIKKAVIHTQTFEGPLPPPSILSAYESIKPGFAERIIKMAEDEAAHRRAIEREIVKTELSNDSQERKYNAREILIGQILGFMIGVVTVLAGAFTSIKGQSMSGTFIGTGGVIGLVTVFIIRRKKVHNNTGQEYVSAQQLRE